MNEIKLLVHQPLCRLHRRLLRPPRTGSKDYYHYHLSQARKLSPSRDNCSFGPPHRFSTGHPDLSSKLFWTVVLAKTGLFVLC